MFDGEVLPLLLCPPKGSLPTSNQIARRLESHDDNVKVDAMRDLFRAILSGESNSYLLMTVIRFVLPSPNHRVIRHSLLYLELLDKSNSDGSFPEEMLLVCNALRNNLLSYNEYVRGATLRLIARMRNKKILVPLVEVVLQNLSHRHSYVRRNCVMALFSMLKNFGDDFVPTACEEIERMLQSESDLSTKRNAFLMLLQCEIQRAITFVLSLQGNFQSALLGDILVLAIIELLRHLCKEHPEKTTVYLTILKQLCPPTAPASVALDGARCLLELTRSKELLSFAMTNLCHLLLECSDISVKLIVLDIMEQTLIRDQSIGHSAIWDLIRGLRIASSCVRQKILTIIKMVVNEDSAEAVLMALKKDIEKIRKQSVSTGAAAAGDEMLLDTVIAICHCAVKFGDYAHLVLPDLLNELTAMRQSTSWEITQAVKQLTRKFPEKREQLLDIIWAKWNSFGCSSVLCSFLWLIGVYETRKDVIEIMIETWLTELEPLNWAEVTENTLGEANALEPIGCVTSKPTRSGQPCSTRHLSVGRTSATEDSTMLSEKPLTQRSSSTDGESHLRKYISRADFLLADALAVALGRLAPRMAEACRDAGTLPRSNKTIKQALLILCALRRYMGNPPSLKCNAHTTWRVNLCLGAVLASSGIQFADRFDAYRDALAAVDESPVGDPCDYEELKEQWKLDLTAQSVEQDLYHWQRFRQLGPLPETIPVNQNETPALSALAYGKKYLNDYYRGVHQVTGTADPLHIEAMIYVHELHIEVRIFIHNCSDDQLQGISVQLASHGNTIIIGRPPTISLGPGEEATLSAAVRLKSTETCVLFGHVTYERIGKTTGGRASASTSDYLVLSEILIDLVDFVREEPNEPLDFRAMWAEFEWENKIVVNTPMTNMAKFVRHLINKTKMSLIDPGGKLIKQGSDLNETNRLPPFLENVANMSAVFAVNLYSHSVFGEYAVANISLERLDNGKISGTARIRSRSQGVALSLGDRLNLAQSENS